MEMARRYLERKLLNIRTAAVASQCRSFFVRSAKKRTRLSPRVPPKCGNSVRLSDEKRAYLFFAACGVHRVLVDFGEAGGELEQRGVGRRGGETCHFHRHFHQRTGG
jgi:hypothetical protein